jgi:Tol biopolymer transport system component
MNRDSQTHTPFWIIGITIVSAVVIALLSLRNGTSPPISPTATHTPLEIYLERLPTIVTTSVSKTPTHSLSPTASPIPSSKGSGELLFVSDRDGNEEIYMMDLDGRNQTRLTQNPGRDIDPQWSPDGTKIAFLSRRENKRGLYVMNIDGSQQKLLTSSVVFRAGEFSWSPDSTQLAYSSFIDGYSDISVIHINGSMDRNLTTTATTAKEERGPSWSPDGTKIAFYREYQYFIMNPDGSDKTSVLHSSDLNWSQPHWSPDGLSLLVSTSDEIFSVNKNTDVVVQLTNNLNYDASPAASPDGTKIAFVSSRSQGSHEIFLMSANGDPVEQISNIYDTRAYIYNLMWSSAGNRIIFTISNYRGGLTAEIFAIAINTREKIPLSQDPSSSNYLFDVAP